MFASPTQIHRRSHSLTETLLYVDICQSSCIGNKNSITQSFTQNQKEMLMVRFTTVISYLSFVFSWLSFNSCLNKIRERLNSRKTHADYLFEVMFKLFSSGHFTGLFLTNECYCIIRYYEPTVEYTYCRHQLASKIDDKNHESVTHSFEMVQFIQVILSLLGIDITLLQTNG